MDRAARHRPDHLAFVESDHRTGADLHGRESLPTEGTCAQAVTLQPTSPRVRSFGTLLLRALPFGRLLATLRAVDGLGS